MITVKRLVCLANSRKLSGRCIAGIELAGAKRVGWIRPVSMREHQEVSEHERQYEDGSDPKLLDIMNVPLIEARPKEYQRENWLLDPEHYWERVGSLAWRYLHGLTDPAGRLWINGNSTYNGVNDRIPVADAAKLHSSLHLIHVQELTLSVFKPGGAFGDPKRRVQGRFVYAEARYHLWVTDPTYERAYLAKPDGEYAIGESFLTVSLGEPYEGFCYKLIAAIMKRGG